MVSDEPITAKSGGYTAKAKASEKPKGKKNGK